MVAFARTIHPLQVHVHIFVYLLFLSCCCCCASNWDIIAVLPDRSTAYPNSVQNGLLFTASQLNVTLQIQDYMHDSDSDEVLTSLINTPQEHQPKLYLIWPSSTSATSSASLLQELWQTHQVPILQLHELPTEAHEWEWDHLLGFVGPSSEGKAQKAGYMMKQAMQQKLDLKRLQDHEETQAVELVHSAQSLQQQQAQVPTTGVQKHVNVVALGYIGANPTSNSAGAYHLSMQAFEAVMATSEDPKIHIVKKIPLKTQGPQAAYDAILDFLVSMGENDTIDGIYCMDDTLLLGAYQAILDHSATNLNSNNITLVGTSCNGVRELLANGQQFGTTVEGPYLEGQLAMSTAAEYLQHGKLQPPFIRFTPNPSITVEDPWQDDMLVEFQGVAHSVDALCTWESIYDERVAGLQSIDTVANPCSVIDCSYINDGLKLTGLLFCGIIYVLAMFCAACLGYYMRQNKDDKPSLQLPMFLWWVILGTVICNTSIIFLAHPHNPQTAESIESLDTDCFTAPWLLVLGHMITCALLVARMMQVDNFLGSGARDGHPETEQEQEQHPGPHHSPQERPIISFRKMGIFVMTCLFVDVVVLTIWSLEDPFQWEFEVTALDENGYIVQASGQCGVQNDWSLLFPLGIAIFHLILLLYGNILACRRRQSTMRGIGVALFIAFQLLLVTGPLLGVVEYYNGSVSALYFIKVCFVFLHCLSVILCVVLPTSYRYLQGDMDMDPDGIKEKEGAHDWYYGPTRDVDGFHVIVDTTTHDNNGEDNESHEAHMSHEDPPGDKFFSGENEDNDSHQDMKNVNQGENDKTSEDGPGQENENGHRLVKKFAAPFPFIEFESNDNPENDGKTEDDGPDAPTHLEESITPTTGTSHDSTNDQHDHEPVAVKTNDNEKKKKDNPEPDTQTNVLSTATVETSHDSTKDHEHENASGVSVLLPSSSTTDHDLFFLGGELASMFGRNNRESYLS